MIAVNDDADELFAVTMDLLWWLHGSAVDQGVPAVQFDQLCAINELLCAPWRRCKTPYVVPELPYTVAGMLLDELLARLGVATSGFGGRVAVMKAQRWLRNDKSR